MSKSVDDRAWRRRAGWQIDRQRSVNGLNHVFATHQPQYRTSKAFLLKAGLYGFDWKVEQWVRAGKHWVRISAFDLFSSVRCV